MKATSATKVTQVVTLLKAGLSCPQISSRVNLSPASISRIHKKECSEVPISTGGRPKKLSENDLRYAARLVTSGKADNAVQVTRALRTLTNQPLSAQTVRNHMKGHGLKARVKKKRPLLSAKHKKARLDYAIAHLHDTVEDHKKVIWSDKTKINRLGSDGKQYVWVDPRMGFTEREVQGTLKFGEGSLMFWGCMTYEGVGYGCRIEGKMDADLYCGILEEQLQDTLEYFDLDPANIIFQQDNDPKHTSKKAQKWFKDHDINVMP